MGSIVRTGILPTALRGNQNMASFGAVDAVCDGLDLSSPHACTRAGYPLPFLRIPPFPGSTPRFFSELGQSATIAPELAKAVTRFRVGGTYWARQPRLAPNQILVRSTRAWSTVQELFAGRRSVLWNPNARANVLADNVVTGDCDPWHMVESASAVVVEPADELRVIAALLNVPCFLFDHEERSLSLCSSDAGELLASALSVSAFTDPFTGEPISASQAVELCGFWRELIDSNRALAGGFGFAFWKQKHIGALLWGGCEPFKFLRNAKDLVGATGVAVWRSKTSPRALCGLREKGIKLVEIEDGFLRSRGLGADCVPPLSITLDPLGAHFDPSQASTLENLLQNGCFDEQLLRRASELRQLIVEQGLGKYERGFLPVHRPNRDRRVILVPGQVEDDRAVVCGGCGLQSNLELLRLVRDQAPDAYIIYKPHPDVLAGHRKGALSRKACLEYADDVASGSSIASIIETCDEVHVNTSLAGFEALLRGKLVTTYGVPFYAGWGLTTDLGPVPGRRTAHRTVEELVAATLLIYPRYLDPLTGLPCPAEVIVDRLAREDATSTDVLVGVRRLQGKVMRRLRSFMQ